jgi:hypothetical protein
VGYSSQGHFTTVFRGATGPARLFQEMRLMVTYMSDYGLPCPGHDDRKIAIAVIASSSL